MSSLSHFNSSRLQKPSTKTRIETFNVLFGFSFSNEKVAKAVYENKDWNSTMCISCSSPLSSMLQKPSTKTRIETENCRLASFRAWKSCKSRLRKQGLKHDCHILSLQVVINVAKAVYENKDWNFIISCATCSYCSWIVAKAVYENKDWNILLVLFTFIFYSSCKSGLPKQGLKHLMCFLVFPFQMKKLQKPSTKTRIETPLCVSVALLRYRLCCKSRLRKQGLKQRTAA